MQSAERRRHPRVALRLPLKLHFHERTVESHIEDLSQSGMRVRTPTALPLMSRVQIALELPDAGGRGESALALHGVVVRCEEIAEAGSAPFDTAIYFDDLSDIARMRLSRFVGGRAS